MKGKVFILKSLTLLYFMEYSRGMPTIPEDSFARLLLRNTSLEEEQVQKYLSRLCKRLKQRKVRKLRQKSEKKSYLIFQD